MAYGSDEEGSRFDPVQSLAGGCTPQRAKYGPLSDLTAAEYAEGAREYAEMLAMVQQGKDDVREEAGGSTATGKRQEWGQEMERYRKLLVKELQHFGRNKVLLDCGLQKSTVRSKMSSWSKMIDLLATNHAAKWQAIHKDQKAFLAKEGGVMEAEKDERFDREWEQLNPMERQNMRDSAFVMLQDDPRVQQGAKLTFLGLSAQPDLASALAACKVDPAAA